MDEFEVIADKGHYDGAQIKACLQKGIIPTIQKAYTSANRKKGLFTKQDFRYDQKNGCYWCPAGEIMTFRFQTTEKGSPDKVLCHKLMQRLKDQA